MKINLNFRCPRTDFYKQVIRLLASAHPEGLSRTEVDIIDQIFHQGETEQKLITAEVRKHICSNLNMSAQNLNNYITKLKKKGYIVYNRLNPKLNWNLEEANFLHLNIIVTPVEESL